MVNKKFENISGNIKHCKACIVGKKGLALALILLFSVSTLTFLSTSQPVYASTQNTAIHGTVTDEAGSKLSDVAVSLYNITGGLVTGTITNSFGDFVLTNVEFGTYNLHINQLGYTESVTSISVDTFGQQLGTFVLSSGLTLSTSIMSVTVSPGDKITIPITVGYSGEKTEVADLIVSHPTGWSTRILNGNYEVTKVSLSSGQNIALQLELTISSATVADTSYNVSLTALGTTNATLTFAFLVQTQATATVSGTVLDENKNGLNAVAINAYSTNGLLLKSAETASDGSYTIDLPIASASSLQYSKDGYKDFTKNISLTTSNLIVNLDSITLTKALKLTSSISSIVTNPANKLLLTFTISNVGGDTETAAFSVSYPSEWSTRILDANGHEIQSVSLLSGATSNYQLEVTIPLGSTGPYNLTLSAMGKITSTLNFEVMIESVSNSVLSCQFPGKSASSGDSVKFQVSLTNPFSVEMRFKVSVDSVPSNWSATVKTSSGDSLTEVLLNASESVNLIVQVDTSSSATTGQVYELIVKAESDAYNVTDSLPVTVTLTEATNEVTLTAALPEIAITAGNAASYSVTIANLGITDKLLFLSIQPPADWTAVFKSGSTEVTTLYLYSGNTSALTLTVTPPSTVAVGSYVIPVQVKSESGVVLDDLNLTTTVTGSYAVSLTLSTYLTSTNSGGTTTFTATVTNSGYSTLTGVTVVTTLPETDWSSTGTPVQVGTLGPKESASFTINVKTTDNTVSGDYMVTAKASSDQVSSDSSQVRVTVSTSTSWGIYGVGIAAVFIVALVLVFRKFKRR